MVDKSTLLKVLSYIDSSEVRTPVLAINGEKVRANISLIGHNIRNCKAYYAVKANPDIGMIRLLNDTLLRDGSRCGFEISSMGELKVLMEAGVEPSRIICSNPVKTLAFLREAVDYGVTYYSYDSATEVDKLAVYAPGCNVYVRLSIPNEGSEWPLSKKFGVEVDDAVILLEKAVQKGLNPVGVTFHVGSQCNNIYNWNIALDKARLVFDMAGRKGIELSFLNIGGGYPVKYTKSVLAIDTIEKHINALIAERFGDDVSVAVEPGRAVVGDAGIMISSVTGKADRLDEKWLYIDVGVFNGLMESVGGIRYTYIVETTQHTGNKKSWVLAGPSCDSFDVIDKNVELNEPEVGDIVLVLSAGAYTISYASEFNGITIPKTVIL
ncbi:MAG: type III PLP-dependent enzyme [Nitrospirae bacterium]|nr:type III PLP-dependent enzyme [Nitrospirota bacterium]